MLRDHPAVQSDRIASGAAEALHAESSQKGRGRGLGAAVNFDNIETALRSSGRVRSNEALVILDCRGFADAVEEDRFHLGSDPAKQKRLSESKQFPSWVKAAKAAITRVAVRQERPPLCIVCFCRKGCHRSVALAILLETTLSALKEEFVIVEDMDHLSRHVVWGRGHCAFEACQACQGPTAGDVRHAAEACCMRLWRSAGGWA